jgi:hypothetical protein
MAEFLVIRLNVGQQQGKANLTETSAGFFRSVYMEDGVER